MTQQTHHPKKTPAVKQTAATKAIIDASATRSQEKQGITQEERHRLIAETAYLIAEQRGFQGDRALDDWQQAEMEVDVRFASRH